MYRNTLVRRGSLTLEILIALSLLVTALVGATLIVHGAQSTSLHISQTYGGMHILERSIQEIRASLQKEWHTKYTSKENDTGYTLSSTIHSISSCTKKITVTAESKRDGYLRTESMSSVIGSPDEARRHGGTCDPIPIASTWDTPESKGSVMLPQGASTGIALYTQSSSRYALVTATSSYTPDADFFVIDVTDISNPHILSSLDTGRGLKNLVRGDAYVYALQDDNTNQLQVIDIRDPVHPSLIAQVSLPYLPAVCSATTTTCYAGRSIFYYDGNIFIGTSYIAFGSTEIHHNEFHIFCVSNTSVPGCNPRSPRWLGSLNVNHNVNDIFVQGNYAYLATSDTEGELMIVDITDPAHMAHPDNTGMRFNARTTTGSESTEDGMSVSVLGDYTYLGRERVNNALERDFYILDTHDPHTISPLTSLRLGLSTRSTLSDIAVHDSRAFITTTDVTRPLFIFNITDAANPTLLNFCSTLTTPLLRLIYADNLLFTSYNTAVSILADTSLVCAHP